MNISVCTASYNGENFIKEQIFSILREVGPHDEIIIVDDCSTDHTVKKIKSINDKRIKLTVNDRNMGEVASFSKAISLANNNIIFLSDQDDLWIEGRVFLMAEKLLKFKVHLISSNFEFIDKYDRECKFDSTLLEENNSSKHCKNILSIFSGKTGYFGCAMAFHKNIIPLILPIPSIIESHDLWIALAANLLKSNYHLNNYTLKKRIHDKNISIIRRKLVYKLYSRMIFFYSIIIITFRIIKYKKQLKIH